MIDLNNAIARKKVPENERAYDSVLCQYLYWIYWFYIKSLNFASKCENENIRNYWKILKY